MDVVTVIGLALVVVAVAFIGYGNLRPARTARIPDRQKRDD